MNLLIEAFAYDNSGFLQSAVNMRNSVFVDELGFDKHFEFDGKDFKAMHYIMFLDDKPVGCSRWTEKDQTITIDRFCIIPEFRRRGFAFVFIKFIIADIKPSKKNIFVYSTAASNQFFAQFGFGGNDGIMKPDNSDINVLQLNQ